MSVVAAQGFVAGGMACGIKTSGAPDLAIVATADGQPVTAAGTFTSNLCQAAPVQVSRRHLADGQAAAVVLNSGNANAATGEAGRAHAVRMAALTATGLGVREHDVLVCSTGLIGIPMPFDAVERGIPQLTQALGATEAHGIAAATSILTTDTVRKEAVAHVNLDGVEATIGGMAKGAAMLSPAMATMLCVITTDAAVDQAVLHHALACAVGETFDCLDVDGARSTNDTVLVLANGAAGNPTIVTADGDAYHHFLGALTEVCASIAQQMARDAEGATKFCRVTVQGARSKHDAKLAARGITKSQLVQCSLYGGDPYWGRVISECGASGAYFDPELVTISYQGIANCRHGIAAAHDEAKLNELMQQRDIEILVDLGTGGHGRHTMLTTDLAPGYIDENMRTS
jgi:glutamate N-acetyltransferase / amino-acid N-acetyltransferase